MTEKLYRIRPLKWCNVMHEGAEALRTSDKKYMIQELDSEKGRRFQTYQHQGGGGKYIKESFHSTLEDAKAQCEEHREEFLSKYIERV